MKARKTELVVVMAMDKIVLNDSSPLENVAHQERFKSLASASTGR